MEPSWLPSSRGAASRPPAQQKVVSPGSDSVMRRLGLVIRGHDGLTRTRSHGALSLIRLPLPIVPPPVPSPRPPAPDLYRHTRGVHNKCPTVGSHSSSKKNPGSTNRIAGRAVCGRCRLGVPLPANCRLVWARSAARLSSRRRITSVGGPLPGAGRGDDEHEAKRCCCAVFLPEHDGGW